MSDEKILTTIELAEHFKVSKRTIARWVESGMPCLRPNDRTMRFILSDCVDWMQSDKAAV